MPCLTLYRVKDTLTGLYLSKTDHVANQNERGEIYYTLKDAKAKLTRVRRRSDYYSLKSKLVIEELTLQTAKELGETK